MKRIQLRFYSNSRHVPIRPATLSFSLLNAIKSEPAVLDGQSTLNSLKEAVKQLIDLHPQNRQVQNLLDYEWDSKTWARSACKNVWRSATFDSRSLAFIISALASKFGSTNLIKVIDSFNIPKDVFVKAALLDACVSWRDLTGLNGQRDESLSWFTAYMQYNAAIKNTNELALGLDKVIAWRNLDDSKTRHPHYDLLIAGN